MRILSVLLLVIILQGCSVQEPRTIIVKPQCYVPTLEELPQIDAGELYDAVGSDVYYLLEDRENKIVTWGFRLETIVKSVCEPVQ